MKKLATFNLLIILLISLFLASPGNVNGKTHYVDRNHRLASDSNPGTLDLPWLTIQHASEIMAAGDTVYIRDGIYHEHVRTEHSGNPNGYIVFSAYKDETPVIDGTGVQESQNGFIIDQSYIKLIGLEIRNWGEVGIWAEGASNFEISDCEVHHVSFGIGVSFGSHDFVLNRVEMHHFFLFGFDASPGNGLDCYNGVLNDCISYAGIDPDQNVDGFALGHGNQHDFIFNRCQAYDVYDGFDIGRNGGGSNTNIVINGCSSHDCWYDNYKIGGSVKLVNCLGYNSKGSNVDLHWLDAPANVTLQNCTFENAAVFNIYVENSKHTLNMFNCILAGGDNIGLAFEQKNVDNYKGDYNLFQNHNQERVIAVAYEDEFTFDQVGVGAWTDYSGQDAHSHVTYSDTSIFVDPLNINLQLLPTTGARGRGKNAGAPSEDYEGHPRPVGKWCDIGAYEFHASAKAGET